MTIRIAIIGAGTLGEQLAHYLNDDARYTFVGYFDDILAQTNPRETIVLGDSKPETIKNTQAHFDMLMMGIGYNHLDARQQLFDRLCEMELEFLAYAHPSVTRDASVVLKPGAIVLPGCVLDRGVVIRQNTLLNTGCVIAHDTQIGPHTFLGPAVQCAGFIDIGDKCFIGIGTTIIDGRTITTRTQTGGGSVITKDLDGGLWVGVPARFVRAIS